MKDIIATPSKTKEILKKYDFYFKKSYGQNFIIDNNVLKHIVSSASINKNDYILEIGPGIGSLTQLLAESAKKVISVEIDSKLIPILNDIFDGYTNIEFLNADILKININEIIEQKNNGKAIKVVANLPYYITTPIIMKLLENNLNIETITIMIQEEVAERIIAKPGTKNYGALSLAIQYYCKPEIIFNVPANCFIPKPNVNSAVINLKILDTPSVNTKSSQLLFKVIKIAFSQRRKTLLNCLNNSDINLSKDTLLKIIKVCGFDEKVRGEALTLEQLSLLSDEIYNYKEF